MKSCTEPTPMSSYNVRIKDIFSGYEVIKSFGAEKIIKNVHDKTLASMEQKSINTAR